MKAALIFKAGELYELGCNSSQAVCGALAGHYGLDQETAFRMASSFGDGTSRLRGTCGAADALVIMAGSAAGSSSKARSKSTPITSGGSDAPAGSGRPAANSSGTGSAQPQKPQ